jgi:NAD(P)H-dependent flavin oxidoreductase YrpB (nitropropane dioxygenase family)
MRRASLAAARHLDRVIVPGSAVARAASVPVANGLVPDYIHPHPGFPYDAAVTDLAATTDIATARWAARAMELPSDKITSQGHGGHGCPPRKSSGCHSFG